MMNYKKKTKIAALITVVLAVLIIGFIFRKPSYYMAEFPYEKLSDINAEDMVALILDKINHPKAEIYINTQFVRLNTDYTLNDFTSEVLISEYDKDGVLIYRPYQILISPDSKSVIINPQNFTMSADTEYRHCTFKSNWTALSMLPVDAIDKSIMRDSPDYYLLQYTPNNLYENSSPQIQHIFYDIDGVIDSYLESPSVMFNFWPTYQNEDNPNSFTGEGTTVLYYYELGR